MQVAALLNPAVEDVVLLQALLPPPPPSRVLMYNSSFLETSGLHQLTALLPLDDDEDDSNNSESTEDHSNSSNNDSNNYCAKNITWNINHDNSTPLCPKNVGEDTVASTSTLPSLTVKCESGIDQGEDNEWTKTSRSFNLKRALETYQKSLQPKIKKQARNKNQIKGTHVWKAIERDLQQKKKGWMDIAATHNVSVGTVSNVAKSLQCPQDSLNQPPKKCGPKPKVQPKHVACMLTWLEEGKCNTLGEISKCLMDTFGIAVSINTVSNHLRRAEYSWD